MHRMRFLLLALLLFVTVAWVPQAAAYTAYMDFLPEGSWQLTLQTYGQDYSSNTFQFNRIEFFWLSGDQFESPWVNGISNSWGLLSSSPTFMAIGGALRPAGSYVQYTMHFGPDSSPPAAWNVKTYRNGELMEWTYTEWSNGHLTDYDLPLPQVPEPAWLPLLGLGIASIGLVRKRKRTS